VIRQPTPMFVLFAWWRAALEDPDLPREEGFPQCGFYKTRLVNGGPWVAARIWCEREIDLETCELLGPEKQRCEVDGRYVDPLRIWTYLKPITRAEYDAILHRRLNIAGMMTPRETLDLTRRPIWTP